MAYRSIQRIVAASLVLAASLSIAGSDDAIIEMLLMSRSVASITVDGIPPDAVSLWYPSQTQDGSDLIGGYTAVASNGAAMSTNGFRFSAGTQLWAVAHTTNHWADGGNYSVGAWVLATQAVNNARIVGKYNLSGATGVDLGTIGGWDLHFSGITNFAATTSDGIGQAVAQTTSGIYTGFVWRHVASTYNRTNQILYIDGIAVATLTQSRTATPTTEPLKIGGRHPEGGGSSSSLNGFVDAVTYYRRVLTPSEVEQLMESTRGFRP